MIFFYRVLSNILYPILIIFLYIRVLKKKEDPFRFKEKISVKHFKTTRKKDSRLIWFHAASIGEFKSIIPILENLNLDKNKFEFLITTSTMSSANIALSEIKRFKNVKHRYMPFDVDYLIKKFLDTWRPERIFLVDSEIWPNLIIRANKKKIPLALINARLTKKSFNRWLVFLFVAKKIFGLIDLCLCSNVQTKKYLEKLNASNVKYIGNIKLSNLDVNKKLENINSDKLSKSRFWLAASVHKEEDIFCIKTHIELKKKFDDVITIIAPRHIERVNQIKLLSESFNLKTQILNINDVILEEKEILIVNAFGVLNKYFKYAKSVFIGKSMIERLKNDSGQNPIDAAKFNCKIYHGPYVANFSEIYDILKEYKISKKIENYEELSKNLSFDLRIQKKDNNNLGQIQELGKNILADTMKLIKNFLNDKT